VADADAIVIGAGPNGLVAANLLADAGWQVLVLEAHDEPGGAVRSSELVAPGFVADWGSSFYPLGFASPVLHALDLERHGLRWVRSPLALAHPSPGGCAFVDQGDIDATAASLDAFAPGDGNAWRKLYGRWTKIGPSFLEMLLAPFPPVRGALRVAGAANVNIPWLTWYALASLRRAMRGFKGEGGRLLLAGNTLHTDLPPDAATGALFGWLLASLAQDVGFPVPEGGAGRLTDALVARLEAAGGEVRCGTSVERIEVRDGQAVGVRVADGGTITARNAVLADTSAPALYQKLLQGNRLPRRVRRGMHRFRWDHATLKVDWALDAPVPWVAEPARRAGTVHVTDSVEDVFTYCRQIEDGLVPAKPFLVVGQMTTTDPTRSPRGTETLWAYTHVPQHVRGDAGDGIAGRWDDADGQRGADRIESVIERHAPGFRALVRGRHVLTPSRFEAADDNLVGGALGGGTSALRQQLFLRPVPGLRGGARTSVRRLYLASAAAHPGGGVHGACGANAAHLALRDARH
jgi:phytoene dehydrogenase-like protein